MTLSEFQYIYAWEYGHRMLGRVVGVAFAGPWLYLTLRRRHAIPAGYQPRLAALGAMGAAQGAVGWWMVQSGLGEDRRGDAKEIRVQPGRLATHLGMALATYGALLWTALDMFQMPHQKDVATIAAESSSSSATNNKFPRDALRHASKLRMGAVAVTGLTAVTVISGALVAGNDAGRAFNTFPKMDGQWIPSDLWTLQPLWRNGIENTATVQWNHRVLGTATAATGLSVAAYGLLLPRARRRLLLTPQVRQGLTALGAAVTAQFTLGVTTLLWYVPLSLAAAHQLGSVAVFTSGVYLLHALRYARPVAVRRAVVAAVAPKQVV